MFRLVYTFLLCLAFCTAFAADDDPIHFEKIHQSKVRKLLIKHNILKRKDFSSLKETCSKPSDSSFNKHYISYEISGTPDQVWDAYMTLSPSQSWSGKMATFGLMYNPDDDPMQYSDTQNNQLRPGQIFVLQLKLLKGVFKMAVANKVTKVDAENREFQVCYINSGASKGSQNVKLTALPNGNTLVEHISLFKSKSKFRDKNLYPKIHEKIISEFHSNIAASLNTTIASL